MSKNLKMYLIIHQLRGEYCKWPFDGKLFGLSRRFVR